MPRTSDYHYGPRRLTITERNGIMTAEWDDTEKRKETFNR